MSIDFNLKIKEIDNKEVWENFINQCEEKTFLHSWNWGEFQKMEGEKIWRFGIFENEQLVSVCLVLKIKAKRGTFLFVPHGPSFAHRASEGKPTIKFEVLKILLEELKKLAKEEKAYFIRVAPVWEKTEENNKNFQDLGFRNAPIHMHPELTWELSLGPSEEELLMKMRKTTRYLIKQAEKNPDIEIIKSQNIEDIEKFNQLYQETVQRHHFFPFSLDYLKNEISAFVGDDQILIFLGKYKGEIVCSALIIYYSGTGYYHQGASSHKYAQFPVPYLMQWEAIKEAKKRNCQKYNFWGIAPTDDKKHPWYGLSLFKMGFGGYKKEYIKTQDLPLSWKYWLINIFERIRKLKRRL